MFKLIQFLALLSPVLNVEIYIPILPTDDRLYIFKGIVCDIPDNLKNKFVFSFFMLEGSCHIEVSDISDLFK